MSDFGDHVSSPTAGALAPGAAASRAPWATVAFAFHEPSVLGTRYNLLVNAVTPEAAEEASWRALAEIDRLDRILNWRDAASELSALNAARRHQASPDLFAVVEAAESWRRKTRSAYSGRLGAALDLWRSAKAAAPDAEEAARLVQAAEAADVGLDRASRSILRPDAVRFDLDALAKGYVVDQALGAALQTPGVTGGLLDIGGDIRCGGPGPGGGPWLVGLPDPRDPFDNAPLRGWIALRDKAIATSGIGPRDRWIGGVRRSATLDPRTARPVDLNRSASAVADSAMAADALATAFLVSGRDEHQALAQRAAGASARISDAGGSRWVSGGAGGSPPAYWIEAAAQRPPPRSAGAAKWPDRWVVMVNFTAPPRQNNRERGFRAPYVAIWVSDVQNRPIRTLFLVGAVAEWHEFNNIWWGLNRTNAMNLVTTRSLSTRGSGEYKVLWDGIDDAGRRVPAGSYVIHVETSRERGEHTHRTIQADFTTPQEFTRSLPNAQNNGSLEIIFQRF
jgi:thiamine biosynthesis lipoprotein